MQIDTILFVLAAFAALWLYLRWRATGAELPPLWTRADDPLMLEARAQAKAGLERFFELLRQPHQSAAVKLRFVSSSGEVEYLWAEVLEVHGPQELGVRLVTPPVTHNGTLERVYRCQRDDIVDWQLHDQAGKLYGGFTQRAMFAVARRDGVQIPKNLLAQEKAYQDSFDA